MFITYYLFLLVESKSRGVFKRRPGFLICVSHHKHKITRLCKLLVFEVAKKMMWKNPCWTNLCAL